MLHFTHTQNETLQSRLREDEKLLYSTFAIPIIEKSIAGYVAQTGQPLNLPDVCQHDPTRPYHFDIEFDMTARYTTRSVLTLPLQTSKGD